MLQVPEKDSYPAYFQRGMPGYVLRDWTVVDYRCYELEGTGLWFRGPEKELPADGRYFTAIGAAQTFGCFCDEAYPEMLSAEIGMPGLNLGYPGAGPSFFAQQPRLLDYVNKGSFCVVQVMSGRSTGNALLDNPHGIGYDNRKSDGKLATTESVFQDLLSQELKKLPSFWSRRPFRKLTKFVPLPAVRKLMQDARSRWVADYHDLLSKIEVPTVLLWFSERSPSYIPRYDSRKTLFGPFPQMVNQKMVDAVRPAATAFASSVSSRGIPQPLINRFTGEPAQIDLSEDNPLYKGKFTANTYYPSPEMQEDVVHALRDVCSELAASR